MLFSTLALVTFLNGVWSHPLQTRQNPSFPDPNDDPFYVAPKNISQYHAGQVIRSRSVMTTSSGSAGSYQVLYRSTNHFNEAIATVATIWAPLMPASPPKIFTYTFAEDGDNLDCDPSWAWVLNSGSDAQESERVAGPEIIEFALNNGYYAVSPDAEGPKSTWLVGITEGRATLDAIRTAKNFYGLKGESVGIYGYSGGAHTAVWASTLAESYAPDVNVVGAAFGGTPVDLRSSFNLDNDKASSLVVGAAIFGLGNGYPELNKYINSQLTTQGKKIAADLRSRQNCTHFADATFNGIFDYTTIFKSPNALTSKIVNDTFAQESLLQGVASHSVAVPKFPRLEYHGTNDTTVDYPSELLYVQQQCKQGANIQFVEFLDQDHAGTAVAGLAGALDFVKSALSGTVPRAGCTYTKVSTSS